ncbi:transcription factor tau subunit sfc1 [Diplogelasinospora grovesii]|uniref:Transcription factor tau subunit sfc1 n=1 Tax=Diplogelasinospora grovesii TaxID=303347 RepID=A0AAN6MZ21_9PEZI|nr:transcription factor tau subunit sfc1 [Diplogelasinospora grovesii]
MAAVSIDPELRASAEEEHAPIYTIPDRRLGALEHPLTIKNVDKAIKTFGQNFPLQAVLESASPQISIPLYLRYDNPTVRPLTSHNALTHNVVVKVTVPKRTGRKRKRGSDGPWEGSVEEANGNDECHPSGQVCSRDRLDAPKVLRRKLSDNVGKYTVEPIGVVTNTHRYRGLTDFQYAMGESKFMTQFVDKIMPGDVAKFKEFTLTPGIETGSDIDLIPPPNFTPMTLPFSYNYAQNPYTKEVGDGGASPISEGVSEDAEYGRVVNVTSRVPAAGYFIAHDEYPVPSEPRRPPDMRDPQVAAIMAEMRLAMEERPIWTRRSMWNRLGAKFASLPKSGSLVRHCLQYAGYQFKGGPWRDALVKYGLDPRTDPKYRVYQTLIFKLHKTRIGSVGRSWQAVRRNEIGVSNYARYWREIGDDYDRSDMALRDTHVFDGNSFSTDGKVWQVCDITDPLLARLFSEAEIRSDCDVEISGFYHRVLWSVAKAIMKCKMLAIRFSRSLTDDDFGATLHAIKGPENGGDGGGSGTSIGITLPDLQLTLAEYQELRGRGQLKPGPKKGRDRFEEKRKNTHYRVRIPVKEAEERDAEKMIRLLTKGPPITRRRKERKDKDNAPPSASLSARESAAVIPAAVDDDEVPLDPRLQSGVWGDGDGTADATEAQSDTEELGGEEEDQEADTEGVQRLQDLLDKFDDEDSYEGGSGSDDEELEEEGDLMGEEAEEDGQVGEYSEEEDEEGEEGEEEEEEEEDEDDTSIGDEDELGEGEGIEDEDIEGHVEEDVEEEAYGDEEVDPDDAFREPIE